MSKTIFEQIAEETKGKKYSTSWYRKKVQTIANDITLKKIKSDERKESTLNTEDQDSNEVRNETRRGHLYLFEYEATHRSTQYYDRYPLVYVLDREGDHFIGANLHYMNPKARLGVIKSLQEKDKLSIPSVIIHKYLYKGVKGLFLDLGISEWETAIYLPIEDFVYDVGNKTLPYKKDKVWQRTYKFREDKFRSKRIVENYSKETKK